MLVRVFDHDDGGVYHRAERNRDAAEAHDVRAEAEHMEEAHRDQHPDREHDDRDERAADMQQEDKADQGDNDAFFGERVLQSIDGAMDEFRAVVDRLDLHSLRQGGCDLGELLLDAIDDPERVLPIPLQGNTADDLAGAVEFGDAATFLRSKLNPGDIAQQHRRAALHLEHDLLNVADIAQIASTANHVFGLGHLDDATADIAVARADGAGQLPERQAVGL